jgi:hypothetical protein
MPRSYLERHDPTGLLEFIRFCQANNFAPLIAGIRHSLLGMLGDQTSEVAARRYLDSMENQPTSQAIRTLHAVLKGRLEGQEWSDKVFPYLSHCHQEGVPFPEMGPETTVNNTDPAAISQIKKFINALYYAECSLARVQKFELDPLDDWHLAIPAALGIGYEVATNINQEVYEICRLVTHPDMDLKTLFAPEVAALMPVLQQLASSAVGYSIQTDAFLTEHQINLRDHQQLMSQAGVMSGAAINLLKPNQKHNYRAVTQSLAELPISLNQWRHWVDNAATNTEKPGVGLDAQKLKTLERDGVKILDLLNGLRPGALLQPYNAAYLVYNIPAFNHIQSLTMSILKEITQLNESSHHFIRAKLRSLKYELLAPLLASADKAEVEMMLDQGLLSSALLQHVGPLYEQLIHLVGFVDFSEEGMDLLTLEDAHFLKKRLESTFQRDAENQVKKLQLEEEQLEINAFFDTLQAQAGRRLSQVQDSEIKRTLIAQYRVVQPHLADMDLKLSNGIVRGLLEAPLREQQQAQSWSEYLFGTTWRDLFTDDVLMDEEGVPLDEVNRILMIRPQLQARLDKARATLGLRHQLNQDVLEHTYRSQDELALSLFKSSDHPFVVNESKVFGNQPAFVKGAESPLLAALIPVGGTLNGLLHGLTNEQALLWHQLLVVKQEKLEKLSHADRAYQEFVALLATMPSESCLWKMMDQQSHLHDLYILFQPLLERSLSENVLLLGFNREMKDALSGLDRGSASKTVGQFRDLSARMDATILSEKAALSQHVATNVSLLQQLHLAKSDQLARAQQAQQAFIGLLANESPDTPLYELQSRNQLRTLYGIFQPLIISAMSESDAHHSELFDLGMIHALEGSHLDKLRMTVEQFRQAHAATQPIYVSRAETLRKKREAIQAVAGRAIRAERRQLPLLPDIQGEARATYFIKKPMYASHMNDLRLKVDQFYGQFNQTLREVLKPEERQIFEQLKAWFSGTINLEEGYLPFPELLQPCGLLRQSEQVIGLKRLANCLFHLKEASIQLELLNNASPKEEYTYRTFRIEEHVRDAHDLLVDLSGDPYLSALGSDLWQAMSAAKELLLTRAAPHHPSAKSNDVAAEPRDAYFYSVNSLLVLPKQIACLEQKKALSPYSAEQMHAHAERVAKDLRRIVEKSDSYVSLALETDTFVRLYQDLSRRLTAFQVTTYDATMNHLSEIYNDDITSILLAVDAWEAKLLLNPGVVANPMKELLDTYYQGFLKPLGLNSLQHIALATSMRPFEKRKVAMDDRLRLAEKELEPMVLKQNALDGFLKVVKQSQDQTARQRQNQALVDAYKVILPSLKEGEKDLRCKKAYRLVFKDAWLDYVDHRPEPERSKLRANEARAHQFADEKIADILDEHMTAQIGDDSRFELMKKLVEIRKAHVDGLVSTKRVVVNTAKEQLAYLERQLVPQVHANQRWTEQYIKSVMKHQLEAYRGLSRGIYHQSEAYDKALFTYMAVHEAEILHKTQRNGDIDQQVRDHLAEKIKDFEGEHVLAYQQLESIIVAMNKMSVYLSHQDINPSTLAYENDETLRLKRSHLKALEKIIADDTLSVQKKIDALREHVGPKFQRDFLRHAEYQPKRFAWHMDWFISFAGIVGRVKTAPTRQTLVDELTAAVASSKDPEIAALEKAMARLRVYIQAQGHLMPGVRSRSFETKDTLKAKEEVLRQLEGILNGPEVHSSYQRLKKIRVIVEGEQFKDTVLKFHHYEPYTFGWLAQCLLAFFEAVKIYKPEPKVFYEAVVRSIEKTSVTSNTQGFFYQPTGHQEETQQGLPPRPPAGGSTP